MQALKSGDKVGVISPSNFLRNKEVIELGIDYLRSLGFELVLGQHVYDQYHYMGGTPQDRAADINAFFRDTNIKAIFATCGGGGSQHILPFLDYENIKNNPKPIFGFSDVTALQLGIYAQTKVPQVTGFTLKYDFRKGAIDGIVDSSLRSILRGEKQIIQGGETVIGGSSEGILVGGSLTMLRNLCGTKYYPDLTDCILLVEDDDEKTYKVDLMMLQLRQNPNFNKLKGIIFGKFTDSQIIDPEDGTIDDNINYFCQNLSIPVIKNFPHGHIASRYVLPIGERVKLDAITCRLEYI